MAIPVAFTLRPPERHLLKTKAQGNQSFLIRTWLKDFLANPVEFQPIDDSVKQTTVAIEDEVVAQIKQVAAERNVSMMTLVRQIVEHNLRG